MPLTTKNIAVNGNTVNEPVKRKLMRFNKDIKISIPLDQIANDLYKLFKEDCLHRELITEQIIGHLDKADRISSLYNSLHGHDVVFDVQVGQICHTSASEYNYASSQSAEIGYCKVLGIDRFAKVNSIHVEFEQIQHGKVMLKETHVNPEDLQDVPENITTHLGHLSPEETGSEAVCAEPRKG